MTKRRYSKDGKFKIAIFLKMGQNIPSEISPLFQVSHADEEEIETEDEESRGSDTTEEKRIGSTLCSLIGVSNKGVSSVPLGVGSHYTSSILE